MYEMYFRDVTLHVQQMHLNKYTEVIIFKGKAECITTKQKKKKKKRSTQ